jgi:cytochrome c
MISKICTIGVSLVFLSNVVFAEGTQSGRQLVRPCKACHFFKEKSGKSGPHLFKLIGRQIGSVEGYPYSKALLKIGGEWEELRLAKFLNDPKAFAPGTKMNFSGFKNMKSAKIAAEYFAQLSGRQ